MQLLILIIIALGAGYVIARSRLGDNIDHAGGKVADLSKDGANKVGGWWQAHFGKKPTSPEAEANGNVLTLSDEPEPTASDILALAEAPIEEEKQGISEERLPAEKSLSRRKKG